MSLLSALEELMDRIWEHEPKPVDPPDQSLNWPEFRPIRVSVDASHSKSDYIGNPVHDWAEKRVTAIEATCNDCGRIELRPNHRGAIKGQRRKSVK